MLSCGIILGGWDKHDGGQVFAVPMGGTLMKVPFAIGGSGSGYITGFCDKFFKEGMTEQECREFCTRAVAHAFARDGSSGGCIRLVTITEAGHKSEFVPHTAAPQCYGETNVPQFSGFAPVARS
eukprot:TRINITY_DN11664_c0_g1_i1.p1 TRINITY_DN11664_c0_g1~~TRINITY_DN11664_c0_g1_i1.p1  ORF type:complete len:132 (+),score=9.57 TRINITY_DN11664_c0_g1_i1:27-398(+)